jgi:aspartate aminotransferase-like enzyme
MNPANSLLSITLRSILILSSQRRAGIPIRFLPQVFPPNTSCLSVASRACPMSSCKTVLFTKKWNVISGLNTACRFVGSTGVENVLVRKAKHRDAMTKTGRDMKWRNAWRDDKHKQLEKNNNRGLATSDHSETICKPKWF